MSLPNQVEVITTFPNGQKCHAGTLYINRTGLTFQYASNYIDDPHAYEFAPSLPLALGPYPLEGLGAFSDAAPDRWGRKLLERALQRTRLNEIDYLLGVNDLTRQGAYRFFSHEGPLTGSDGVPILTDLPALLNCRGCCTKRI